MPRWLHRLWYEESVWSSALLPLAWLFGLVAGLRRRLYRAGWLRQQGPAVPVVVVGNISVGGTGKTPLVMWLARRLAEQGATVGIVSRGYGGRGTAWPQRVTPASDPYELGDEPVLLARRTGAYVAVAPARVAAAAQAAEAGVDVILSDDGLQHYALRRDCELAVVDGRRGLGNGRLLPAGPLREPAARLDEVDAVVVNGDAGDFPGALAFDLRIDVACALGDDRERALADFGGSTVHAVAGIGDPERFFAALRAAGLDIVEHPFADHQRYLPQEVCFDDSLPVLMTEKDAVKCASFGDSRHWCVPAQVVMKQDCADRLLDIVNRAMRRHQETSDT